MRDALFTLLAGLFAGALVLGCAYLFVVVYLLGQLQQVTP